MSTDITLEETIYRKFTTRAFSTGAPTTLAGSPVVSIYENDSVTQITAGITLSVDFDGVAGLNHLTIVATAANGFEAGKDYQCVITTGTVDSVSVVGEVVQEFTIGRSAAATDLANATDGLGAIKTDTAAILVDTADMQPKLGTPAADVSADVAAVKAETALIVADTNELQTDDVPTTLATLATAAELAKVPKSDGTSSWNATALAAINAECDSALTDAALATAANLATVDTVADAIKVVTDALGATAAANLALSAGVSGIVVGAAEAGTLSTTQMTTDLTEATDDHYNGRVVIWTSGGLAGQASPITAYLGTTGRLTYVATTEAPSAADTFIIV